MGCWQEHGVFIGFLSLDDVISHHQDRGWLRAEGRRQLPFFVKVDGLTSGDAMEMTGAEGLEVGGRGGESKNDSPGYCYYFNMC